MYTTKDQPAERTSHLKTKGISSRSLQKGRRLSEWRETGWFKFEWNRRNSIDDDVLMLDDSVCVIVLPDSKSIIDVFVHRRTTISDTGRSLVGLLADLPINKRFLHLAHEQFNI